MTHWECILTSVDVWLPLLGCKKIIPSIKSEKNNTSGLLNTISILQDGKASLGVIDSANSWFASRFIPIPQRTKPPKVKIGWLLEIRTYFLFQLLLLQLGQHNPPDLLITSQENLSWVPLTPFHPGCIHSHLTFCTLKPSSIPPWSDKASFLFSINWSNLILEKLSQELLPFLKSLCIGFFSLQFE